MFILEWSEVSIARKRAQIQRAQIATRKSQRLIYRLAASAANRTATHAPRAPRVSHRRIVYRLQKAIELGEDAGLIARCARCIQ